MRAVIAALFFSICCFNLLFSSSIVSNSATIACCSFIEGRGIITSFTNAEFRLFTTPPIALFSKAKIDAIANEIYLAITNAINALKISIASKNNTMVMLDDNLIQNIASFINEYYKSSEIKEQIKNKLIFSNISWELNQISGSLFLPGLTNLKGTLM